MESPLIPLQPEDANFACVQIKVNSGTRFEAVKSIHHTSGEIEMGKNIQLISRLLQERPQPEL